MEIWLPRNMVFQLSLHYGKSLILRVPNSTPEGIPSVVEGQ